MAIPTLQRQNRVTWRGARRATVLFALAAVVLYGVSWAKVSRYDLRALPSPHFSASVKIARVLFQTALGDEPQALIKAGASLPEPEWSVLAPVSQQVEMAGAPPLLFQALRAPPIQL